ncbi:MAG: Hsp20/alpha crystallin family protein [Bacilli bacterium]|nr:Hsp20/alpha crystallin family protein [Bacilli bacterium]
MNLIPRKFYLGDDFFDDFFEPAIKDQMKCDVYEKNGDYHIVLDVPGYDKDDITLECDNGYLTISAEKVAEDNEDSKNYIRRERRYGKFSRSFYVGDIDTESIEAEFKKGTLQIVVPKVEEKPSKKQIEIKEK